MKFLGRIDFLLIICHYYRSKICYLYYDHIRIYNCDFISYNDYVKVIIIILVKINVLCECFIFFMITKNNKIVIIIIIKIIINNFYNFIAFYFSSRLHFSYVFVKDTISIRNIVK